MKQTNFTKYLENQFRQDPSLQDEIKIAEKTIDIALQISELRKDKGLSQHELAEKLGMKQSNIARLESADYQGHTLKTLERVSNALDAEMKIKLVSKGLSISSDWSSLVNSSNVLTESVWQKPEYDYILRSETSRRDPNTKQIFNSL
jgi:transcriptional regulator with XRE-family HTH domain